MKTRPLFIISFDKLEKSGIEPATPSMLGELHNPSRYYFRVMYPPYTTLLYSKTGVYRGIHISLLLIQNIECGYSIEPPRRG